MTSPPRLLDSARVLDQLVRWFDVYVNVPVLEAVVQSHSISRYTGQQSCVTVNVTEGAVLMGGVSETVVGVAVRQVAELSPLLVTKSSIEAFAELAESE